MSIELSVVHIHIKITCRVRDYDAQYVCTRDPVREDGSGAG